MTDQTAATPATTPTRRLTRSLDDKILGGVCAGIAEYAGIDVTLVRLLTVVGVVFGLGSVAIAYVVAWLLLPKA